MFKNDSKNDPYQRQIDRLEDLVNNIKLRWSMILVHCASKLESEQESIHNDLRAHRQRIETLGKMQQGQEITRGMLEQLTMIDFLAEDHNIRNYQHIVEEENSLSIRLSL